MSNKLFNEFLNAKYDNIAEENKRLKKIILLHNINKEAIEEELNRCPPPSGLPYMLSSRSIPRSILTPSQFYPD
jgi:hypothetical protein